MALDPVNMWATDEGDGKPEMRSKELAHTWNVKTFLVAGKRLRSDVTHDQFDQISESIDRLAKAIDRPLVALPPGYVVTKNSDVCSIDGCVVGILAGVADCGYNDSTVPSLVLREDLLAALEQADSLPWAEISSLFTDPDWRSEEVELHVMACGPLAGGCVAYGVLVDLRGPAADADADDDDDEDWYWDDIDSDGRDATDRFLADTTGPAGTVPGLRVVHGSEMDQSSQPKAVYGVRLIGTDWEGSPNAVDMSAQAHQARVTALGELAAQSAYYLISRYD